MKHLFPYFKKHLKESILAPLFKMLEAMFDLIVPLVVAQIINIGIANNDKTYIFTRFGILILMAILGLACSFTAQYFAAKAAIGTSTGLRHELLSHISTLNFSTLDRIGGSTLVTRMTADVNQVQNGVNMFLRLFLRSPFIVFGAMIMAFTIDRRIALIFVYIIPVLFIIVFGIMKLTKPMYKNTQTKLDGVTTATRENLSGVRVVRAFGREERESEHFEEVNGALARAQLKVGRISALMNPFTYVVINIGIILILWLGANQVNDPASGRLSGDVIALVNYLSQILVELVKLANLVVLLGKAIASMGRVGQVLDTESTQSFGDVTEEKAGVREAVAFDNVSLSYSEGADEAISNITFSVEKGETVGIIGSTGSGKSSLISLIARFYDATKGQVTLFGEPIENWDKEVLRRRVAVVMQKTKLFKGTIRSNLLYGDPNATDERLWQALRIAQAEEFVKDREGGLDAVVEQGGRNLSGGQRQRLNIARALVGDPDILILDDSSSALDYATDAALRKDLKKLPDDMALIIVSQRTAGIRNADKILVLDDGELVGIGKHDELIESCEVYREIHESVYGKEERA